jgi:SAM-dependent methyltransferase
VSRVRGLSFTSAAEDYERGRTGWPPEVVDGLAGDAALDLAAGTGKLTRLLCERFQRVVAVEPGAELRAVGARVVPAAEWLDGSAEAIPLQEASVDAVTVGEAFHWFEPAAATAEIARVLRPRAGLVVAFTTWQQAFEPEVPKEARAAVTEVADRSGERTGRPLVESGAWREAFAGAPFEELAYREVPFVHRSDRDGVIAYYLSLSSVAQRPQSERDELRTVLERLVPEAEYLLRLVAEIWRTRKV